jgi:hypothetical protein
LFRDWNKKREGQLWDTQGKIPAKHNKLDIFMDSFDMERNTFTDSWNNWKVFSYLTHWGRVHLNCLNARSRSL